ncbi:MAG: adenylyl-sulfate kinase [Candidatus Omnitrophica bacterium]|nr:adenylyl-sulfate kinase [Candidatus Omnitrophota bacterium]
MTPFVLWFTGLSGSGKSTLAREIAKYLSGKGYEVETLDGDAVRDIFPGTGFTEKERNEHIKRIGFIASLLEKHGVIVLASFISPYKASREFARKRCSTFIEVYVSASVGECEKRDAKGLYKKARCGEIDRFTGISDPYEAPERPELVVDTGVESVEESVRKVIEYIQRYL